MVYVPKFVAIRASRLFAMLCMALALVYAGALTSQIVDQVQHLPEQAAAHDHMIFSAAGQIAPIADHNGGDHHGEDHQADDAGIAHPDEPDASGHHHHSDTGPGLMVLAAGSAATPVFFEALHAPLNDQEATRVAVPGPERPPKPTVSTA